jgi:hypothetical protein
MRAEELVEGELYVLADYAAPTAARPSTSVSTQASPSSTWALSLSTWSTMEKPPSAIRSCLTGSYDSCR